MSRVWSSAFGQPRRLLGRLGCRGGHGLWAVGTERRGEDGWHDIAHRPATIGLTNRRSPARPVGLASVSREMSARRAPDDDRRVFPGRRSFERMLRTCFSTVPSVTHSRFAIPAFEAPSAINARTSRSRWVNRSSRSSRWRTLTSSCTIAGSTTEPPSSTRSIVSMKSSTLVTRPPRGLQSPAWAACEYRRSRGRAPDRGRRAAAPRRRPPDPRSRTLSAPAAPRRPPVAGRHHPPPQRAAWSGQRSNGRRAGVPARAARGRLACQERAPSGAQRGRPRGGLADCAV
jgi:hypothetical protein